MYGLVVGVKPLHVDICKVELGKPKVYGNFISFDNFLTRYILNWGGIDGIGIGIISSHCSEINVGVMVNTKLLVLLGTCEY